MFWLLGSRLSALGSRLSALVSVFFSGTSSSNRQRTHAWHQRPLAVTHGNARRSIRAVRVRRLRRRFRRNGTHEAPGELVQPELVRSRAPIGFGSARSLLCVRSGACLCDGQGQSLFEVSGYSMNRPQKILLHLFSEFPANRVCLSSTVCSGLMRRDGVETGRGRGHPRLREGESPMPEMTDEEAEFDRTTCCTARHLFLPQVHGTTTGSPRRACQMGRSGKKSSRRTANATAEDAVVRPTWHDAPCPNAAVYVLRPTASVAGDACYIVKPSRVTQYIGATTCVERRARQHNGAICGGARRTARARSKRPEGGEACFWMPVLTVTGFRSFREALQFEWSFRKATRRAGRDARVAAETLARTRRWSDVPLVVHDTLCGDTRSAAQSQRAQGTESYPPPTGSGLPDPSASFQRITVEHACDA